MEKSNFALIAQVGSRAYGLDDAASDHDYMALLAGDKTGLTPGWFLPVLVDDDDYYCLHLSDMLDLATCASPLVAPYYDSVTGGSSEILKTFWVTHAAALADIYPLATYHTALEQSEAYLLRPERPRAMRIAIRLLGMMWCRYYTGDLLSARQLTQVWRERYFAARRAEMTAADIQPWFEQLQAPSIRRYFEMQPVNRALYEQHKQVINTVLAKEES